MGDGGCYRSGDLPAEQTKRTDGREMRAEGFAAESCLSATTCEVPEHGVGSGTSVSRSGPRLDGVTGSFWVDGRPPASPE